jgi:hypothetical protein
MRRAPVLLALCGCIYVSPAYSCLPVYMCPLPPLGHAASTCTTSAMWVYICVPCLLVYMCPLPPLGHAAGASRAASLNRALIEP